MASATLEDEDTMEGVKAYWDADAALVAAVPNGLRCGRVASPVATPWATISSKQGLERNQGPAPQIAGAQYNDYRLVTFSVWGAKAAVRDAIGLIRARFDEQPKGSPALTIPNTVCLTRMQPLAQLDVFEQDPTRRKGEDVWKGTRNYQLWTQRIIPG